MTALSKLHIKDIRSRLWRKHSTSYRPRSAPVIGATIHYNGPALPFFPNPERELRFVINVDHPYHQKHLGADGLQYHFVVLSNGEIYQTRNLSIIAWHCGNQTGNEQSIAIHLPLGQGQDARPEQWAATERLLDALGEDYGFDRSEVVGHNEWPRSRGSAKPSETYRLLPKQSACPGPLLHLRLSKYRAGEPIEPLTVPLSRWVLLWDCPVRQAPRVHFEDGTSVPIALWLKAGDVIDVDLVKSDGDAQEWLGDKRWLHLATGAGFIWAANARQLD
jgi:hypothetical protein